MNAEQERIRRLAAQLRGIWPKQEIDSAIEGLESDAICEHFGPDPAAVISARIRETRQREADKAHERATGGNVLPLRGRRRA